MSSRQVQIVMISVYYEIYKDQQFMNVDLPSNLDRSHENNKMSSFKNKIKQIKETTHTKTNLDAQATVHKGNLRNVSSAAQLRLQNSSRSPRSDLFVHEPVIVLKKREKQSAYGLKPKKVKKAQHFVPLDLPKSPPSGSLSARKMNFEKICNTQSSTPCLNKEIEIHIDNDDGKNKACLKKLFKKIHKLSEDLAQSEKERIRLQLQLNNLKQVDGYNRGQQKDLVKLQGDNYRLKGEIELLKNQLRDKSKQYADLKNRTPNHIVKEIVVEKPIQVKVEVPRYVPGPEKIIQVPKYIESQTMKQEISRLHKLTQKLEFELERERQINRKRENQFNVPAIVQKPVYLEKPVYVDRPIYIDRPYEVIKQKNVEIPVQVPYQVPIYIEKPIIDEQIFKKIGELESELEAYIKENEQLKIENQNSKAMLISMCSNIEILKRHNFEKNHQIQSLLHNMKDYDPVQAKATIHKEVKKIKTGMQSKFYSDATFSPRH